MTTSPTTEERISQWLEEAAVGQLPDRVLDASFATTRGMRQARASAWRPFTMSRPIPAMVAVGAAAIMIVAGVVYFRPSPTTNVGGTPPTPSPTASAAPTPTPTKEPLDIDLGTSWTSYTSSQYGLKIPHLRDWEINPADRAYDLDTDAADWLSPAMDDFTAPTGDVRMSVWSVAVDPDTVQEWADVEAWVEAYCQKTGSPSCAVILDGAVRLCVEVRDCHPGILLGVTPPFDHEVQAFFTGGIYADQMVVVTVWRAADDPSLSRYGGGWRFIEGHLGSMCVWREDDRPTIPPDCG
jgi:hypothetical protein